MIKFENKSNGRYYYLYIQRDMLNDVVLTVVRGGRNVRVARNVSILYDNRDSLSDEIARLSKRRIKRGYHLISS